jgi:hypothetical protein
MPCIFSRKRTAVTIVKPLVTPIGPAPTARYWWPVVVEVLEKRRNGRPFNPSEAKYVGRTFTGVAYEPTTGVLDKRTTYCVDNCACVALLRLWNKLVTNVVFASQQSATSLLPGADWKLTGHAVQNNTPLGE